MNHFLTIFPNMDSFFEIFEDFLLSLMEVSLVKHLILVLFVLFLAKALLIILKKLINKAQMKGMDPSARPLVYSLFSYLIYIFALVFILQIFGVNTTGLIAMLGAASLAIGLALKDTLTNIASGILLLFLKPFKAGDYIECGSIKGKIDGIGLFNTTLETVDGLFVSAPNHCLWGNPIVNFSKNVNRRLELTVGIDYKDSIDKALDILKELVEKEPLFLKNPPPQFYVSSLSDSSVDLTFRVWVKNADYFSLLWKYRQEIKNRFDASGITIPFPQQTLHFTEYKM